MDVNGAAEATVPFHAMRCFRRNEIAYPDGRVDRQTRVLWVQARSSYGDLRVPADRPNRAGAGSFLDYSLDELLALGRQQGSFGTCRFAGDIAVWERDVAYQAVLHYPEPGIMSYDGTTLVEDSPSGAYRERWEPQDGSDELHQCFRLSAQKGADGAWVPRPGGVVVAGDYAMLVVDRAVVVPRLADLDKIVKELWPDRDAIAALLDCEFSFGARRGGTQVFDIQLSTIPFREGDSFIVPNASGDHADRSQGDLIWRRWEISI